MKMLTDNRYDNLSAHEFFLYMLLLNRLNISKNNLRIFSDEKGIFIYYSNEEITKHLKCSKNTATNVLKRLESVGLIHREYRKNGLSLNIYVNDVFSVYNRTYQQNVTHNTPQGKPEPKYTGKFNSSAVNRNVSFDIDKATKKANEGSLDFGNMKNKKRRHSSTFQY